LLASRISQGGPQRNRRKGLTISACFGRIDDKIGEAVLNLIVEYYGERAPEGSLITSEANSD
jgi:hypothetical protein